MAVLRIFDVLARVQERSAIKAAVHIPGVRNIADDGETMVDPDRRSPHTRREEYSISG